MQVSRLMQILTGYCSHQANQVGLIFRMFSFRMLSFSSFFGFLILKLEIFWGARKDDDNTIYMG